MVSIDFFGAQEPRMKKITPSSASKTQRNSALEKLARKAEEAERAQAQAQGTLIQVPQASAIKSEYFFQFGITYEYSSSPTTSITGLASANPNRKNQDCESKAWRFSFR